MTDALASDGLTPSPRKPSRAVDLGPLFVVPPDNPSDYAEPSANTDAGAKLLAEATKAANGILNADRSVAMWQVRLALQAQGILANDGKELLDCLGSLGKRMGLAAVDRERPPSWAQHRLQASHANVSTVWARPADVTLYNPHERHRRTGRIV